MKRKIVHDISASSLQVIINQLAGLTIFFLISKYLAKAVFGEISWALAVLMVSYAVLGCGIDQVTVRKTAAGEDASSLLKIYSFHVLLTGVCLLLVLLIFFVLSGGPLMRPGLLFFLAIGQFFIYLSLPFKQIANGKERFRTLLWMSTVANVLRAAGLLLLACWRGIDLSSFVLIYILASAIELSVCIGLAKSSLRLEVRAVWDRPRYIRLIGDSLPQLGVIICNAAIARFDWILLGILSTASVLAEYSFAYKAFELSSLPLLVLAPLLLPRVTKWFSQDSVLSERRTADLFALARFEMILAGVLCLLLNIAWAPVIDWLTDNKYGAVNGGTIFLLSCSLPFLYINNILWSVHFAQGRMRAILFVFIVTFLLTCAGDLALIPFFQGRGAAIAYLLAIVVQTAHFSKDTQLAGVGRFWRYLLLSGGAALLSGFMCRLTPWSVGVQMILASALYFLLLIVCGQIRRGDWVTCKRVMYA